MFDLFEFFYTIKLVIFSEIEKFLSLYFLLKTLFNFCLAGASFGTSALSWSRSSLYP